MRSLIAIAALVASISANGSRFLVIDLDSMDYFWMDFSGGTSNRISNVYFNSRSRYAARRYIGTNEGSPYFDGYLTKDTFNVRRDDGTVLMSGSPKGVDFEGFFYDEQGKKDGRFVATLDYNSVAIHYICGHGKQNYSCVALNAREADGRTRMSPGISYMKETECKFRDFPGKFSHLNRESCEDELSIYYCGTIDRKDTPFSLQFKLGCVDSNYSFRVEEISRSNLLYRGGKALKVTRCMRRWVNKASVEESYSNAGKTIFSVGRDTDVYQFASWSRYGSLNIYFENEGDFPKDLKYLVNEAASLCAADFDSDPPEGFWTAKWWAQPPETPKPTYEVLVPAPEDR